MSCEHVTFAAAIIIVINKKNQIFAIKFDDLHSLDNYGDSCRLDRLGDCHGNLFGESLLHLKTTTEDLHNSARQEQNKEM